MRGKVALVDVVAPLDGITPAYAGKRHWRYGLHETSWDHPRVCGEKPKLEKRWRRPAGSPPHMRGKACYFSIGRTVERITPAHAGKSQIPPEADECRQDHPRACGEKIFVDDWLRHILGSPPHMRGKGKPDPEPRREHRITPAHAGKRPQFSARCACREDHPRVCGEKKRVSVTACALLGSPPRMRGKAMALRHGATATRITPAHAGKRRDTHRYDTRFRDHPRTCGEKGLIPLVVSPGPKSPPHMRGKGGVFGLEGFVRGITPAYAGKSLQSGYRRHRSRDHPRVCGEKLAIMPPMTTYIGSPPRMRGKASSSAAPSRLAGITPAHAGKRWSTKPKTASI